MARRLIALFLAFAFGTVTLVHLTGCEQEGQTTEEVDQDTGDTGDQDVGD